MQVPSDNFTMIDNELCLPLKFKPPKIPAKSKKIYKSVFKRSMKPFVGLYDAQTGIYICSIQKDPDDWIDTNLQKIKERVYEYTTK